MQEVARVAGTAGGVETLDKPGTDSAQQEADSRIILHLALDDEGKARRHEAKQEHAVDVACMVGNDNAVACWQFFEATDLNRHAGQPECRPGRSGDPAAPALEPGQQ